MAASMTMTASFLGGGSAAAAISKQPSTVRRGMVVVKASNDVDGEKMVVAEKEDSSSSNGRRELVFAVAAAAACSVAKIAMADEPKRGTLDARKKYAPICVTMPTAKILLISHFEQSLQLNPKTFTPKYVSIES